MKSEEKVKLVDHIVELISRQLTPDEVPVLVGTLKSRQGLRGFRVAEVGHPVFEFKDRYVIYLQSDTELVEKVYDYERQQFNKKVGFFTVAVPYYKKDLAPVIQFIDEKDKTF
jgi:hypothetical protein